MKTQVIKNCLKLNYHGKIITSLTIKCNENSSKTTELEIMVNYLLQYGRHFNKEIHSLEEQSVSKNYENLMQILIVFANKMDINIKVTDAVAVHRLPTRKISAVREVIVQFSDKSTRYLW